MRGRPFSTGYDPRRGRGPKKGAPNAGRLPNVVRHALQELLVEHGIPCLQETLQDAHASLADKLRAIEILCRYGVGTRVESAFDDGDGRVGIVILPAIDGEIVEPSGNGEALPW